MLKTKAYEQIHVSSFYAMANREPGVFRNSLTEQSPIHNKILLWTSVSLRLCSGKITKAPEKCKQHILDQCT